MADTPTSRTLKYLRSMGHLCEVVEKWNHITHTRKDLFGFIDIISIDQCDTVYGWQATSTGNIQSRIKKIREHENYSRVAAAIPLRVIGWKKYKRPADRKYWRCSITLV